MSHESEVSTAAHYDAVLVGLGITGVYLLQVLVGLGLNVKALDAASGVGGTWFWNRYPDARFDTDVAWYQYYHDQGLLDEWNWSEVFAGQEEIERYLNHAVDRWNLRPYIQLETKVEGAVWDESAGQWDVSLSTDEIVTCKYLVSAAGMLSAPYTPDFAKMDSFKGEMFHTSLWPQEPVDFTGKTVAVIGTGSTGVQIIPKIAEIAESLTVFQRTPNWVTPLNNRPISDEEMKELKARYAEIRAKTVESAMGSPHSPDPRKTFEVSVEERLAKYEELWQAEGLAKVAINFSDTGTDPAANDAWCEFIANKIRSIVKDPAVADKLIPTDHGFAGKRPPMGTNYFETFNRDNVELIDIKETPIVSFTATGIETTDRSWDFDIIVLATGFEAMDGAMLRMNLRGEDGLDLRSLWSEGAVTTFGVGIPGFPNVFMAGGAHASATLSVPRAVESQVDYIGRLVDYAESKGTKVVKTTEESAKRWTTHLVELVSNMPRIYTKSWFFGGNIPGKKPVINQYLAGPKEAARQMCESADHGFPEFEFK